ncbi:uncharacterized protein SAPINGB_P004448 [Magnusiomyces paraingens]|uniref:Uncharacterized protein n=1 Tax=Magnusiomyces paraingens TaxID=2606893 RepID=A0A5E8BUI6_9ASCO|nr:uncharacterized protein SAPINGB_P004448 [Saprochaete ingens]VVT55142.1 unnamed protein product [Saprochaete ingens]
MNKPNHKVIMRRIFGPKRRPITGSKPVRYLFVRQNVHIHLNPRYIDPGSSGLLTSALVANVSEALATSFTSDMSGTFETQATIPPSNDFILEPEMVPLTPAASPPATTMDLVENDIIAIPETQVTETLTEILNSESQALTANTIVTTGNPNSQSANSINNNSKEPSSFKTSNDEPLNLQPPVSAEPPQEPSSKRNRENEDNTEAEEPNLLDIVLKEYRHLRKKAKKNKSNESSVTKLQQTMTGFSKIYLSAVLPKFKPTKRRSKAKKLKLKGLDKDQISQ